MDLCGEACARRYSSEMTSEELEELVRKGIETYNRRDVEAHLSLWDPECEWLPFLTAGTEGENAYRGHDGIRRWFRDTDEMFSEVKWEVQEVRDLGDDRGVILGTIRARGRVSGAEVSSPLGQLFELRDGRILRGRAYPSHEETLAAAEAD
jgi:ketosteroid isomerase-like protein